MSEVKALIKFYESRGWNWMLAAEYTLSKLNGGIMVGHCNCCRFKIRRRKGCR